MNTILAKNWWSLIVRGLAALSLACVALVRQEISLLGLVLLFGGYAMLDGILGLAGAVRASEAHERWATLLIEAIAGIVAGIVTFSWPGASVLELSYVIAAWALLTGGLEIASALQLRRRLAGEMLLLLSGVSSLVLGGLMVSLSLAGPGSIATLLATYALLFGALLIALGFRLRPYAHARLAPGL